MANPRIARLQDQIRVIVAQMLQSRIKDPRLGFVTITDVRLTGDAREATVFYTVMGKEDDLRYAPTLDFVPDATSQTAQDMEELIARARKSDEELASRKGHDYASEPDPYRQDDEAPQDDEQE